MLVRGRTSVDVTASVDAERAALRGLERERDGLRAEVERMRPVVDAARELVDDPCPSCDDSICERDCGVADWPALGALAVTVANYRQETT